MLFKVPFSYTAEVLKPRHRKTESATFWEWLEVEIQEVDDGEAPVAVEWNAEPPSWMGFADRDRWGKVPADRLMQTRWKDGSHWWPVLTDETGQDRRRGKLTPEGLERMSEEGEDYHNPVMLAFHRGLIAQGPNPIDPADYRSVERCTRESTIAEIQARAARLIVCDGLVWRRGGEPLLQALPPRYERRPIVHSHETIGKPRLPSENVEVLHFVARVVENGTSDVKDRKTVLRADRGEEIFTSFGSDKGLARHVETNAGNLPRVLLPETLSYSDEEHALAEAARKLLEWMGAAPRLSGTSRAAAMAWYDLKDALDAAGAAPSGEAADRIAGAVAAYGMELDGEAAAFAARAAERWSFRPIDATEKGPRP